MLTYAHKDHTYILCAKHNYTESFQSIQLDVYRNLSYISMAPVFPTNWFQVLCWLIEGRFWQTFHFARNFVCQNIFGHPSGQRTLLYNIRLMHSVYFKFLYVYIYLPNRNCKNNRNIASIVVWWYNEFIKLEVLFFQWFALIDEIKSQPYFRFDVALLIVIPICVIKIEFNWTSTIEIYMYCYYICLIYIQSC